jgi:hypothetical protein
VQGEIQRHLSIDGHRNDICTALRFQRDGVCANDTRCQAGESLKVLAYSIDRGEYEELHTTIKREGRQLLKIQARRRRARPHGA